MGRLAAAILLACIAAIGYWLWNPAESPQPTIQGERAPARTPGAVPSRPAGAGGSSSAPLASRLAASRDYQALLGELGGRHPLDANAKAYVARMLEECKEVSRSGVDAVVREWSGRIAASARPQNATERLGRLRARLARCRGFEGHPIGDEEIDRLWREAAEAGAPLALATLMVKIGRDKGLGAAHDAFMAALESQDPLALEIAGPAARSYGWISMPGTEQYNSQFGVGWQLAMCDMGIECGRDSPLATLHCLDNNLCEDSYEAVQRNHFLLEPQWRQADEYRRLVRDAFERREWARLGVRPRVPGPPGAPAHSPASPAR